MRIQAMQSNLHAAPHPSPVTGVTMAKAKATARSRNFTNNCWTLLDFLSIGCRSAGCAQTQASAAIPAWGRAIRAACGYRAGTT